MTEAEFKTLKREKLMVASLVDAINFKHGIDMDFTMCSKVFGVYLIVDGAHTFDKRVWMFSEAKLKEAKELVDKLKIILKTGEVK